MVFSVSTLVLDKLLENFFRAATNLSAVLLRICPRRRWQPIRIKKGQCLIGKLAGEILLTITQLRLGEVLHNIGGIGISEQVKFEDFDRGLHVAFAHKVLADASHGNFGPELCFGIPLACVH